jgi:leader peptidase (prepilin peptidase)/N-methyltransferase
MYPLVEFLTGLIFLSLFLKFKDLFFFNTLIFTFTYIYYAIVFSLLIVIAFYDLKHKIIPDTLSLSVGILAFIGLFIFNEYGFSIHIPNLLQFLSGILLALPFAFFWLVSRGAWMGLGDAKLVVGLGWLFGISRALSGIIISFWSGAVLGILLLIFSKQYKMKSEISFAPFLIFGTILSFLLELHIFPVF